MQGAEVGLDLDLYRTTKKDHYNRAAALEKQAQEYDDFASTTGPREKKDAQASMKLVQDEIDEINRKTAATRLHNRKANLKNEKKAQNKVDMEAAKSELSLKKISEAVAPTDLVVTAADGEVEVVGTFKGWALGEAAALKNELNGRSLTLAAEKKVLDDANGALATELAALKVEMLALETAANAVVATYTADEAEMTRSALGAVLSKLLKDDVEATATYGSIQLKLAKDVRNRDVSFLPDGETNWKTLGTRWEYVSKIQPVVEQLVVAALGGGGTRRTVGAFKAFTRAERSALNQSNAAARAKIATAQENVKTAADALVLKEKAYGDKFAVQTANNVRLAAIDKETKDIAAALNGKIMS